MTPLLRILLIIISFITFLYIIINIRKARVKLDAVFFWILFGLMLFILSIFPQIAVWGTNITGFYAPINFILTTIIFLILYKLFTLTLRMSQMQQKIEELTQKLALKEYDEKHNQEEEIEEENV